MMLNEGQLISNRYEIIDKIGSGGMSIVYRAKDIKLERFVTFKVLREEYVSTNEFKARLKEEARAVARLSHPNIVNVYDVGQEDSANYIVMEYIDGATLKDVISRKAPFENVETIGVAMQIAAALSHAHKNKIIHRDIKPQNVLITTSGMVKVTDFGIARSTTSANTVELGSVTMGSVHYLSPEQARGGFIDAKSDLYSLGIVMFEMATGVLPFDGDKSIAVALKHINDPLPDMKQINPEISTALASIIIKLTQKQTINRYHDADELIADLREAIANPEIPIEPIGGPPDMSPTIELTRSDITSIRKKSAGRRNVAEDFDRAGDVAGLVDDIGSNNYDDYEDESEPQHSSDWKMILAGIVTAFAIIAVIVALALPRIKPLFQRSQASPSPAALTVVVPNLIGKQFDDAVSEYSENLVINKLKEETSGSTIAGKIIDQLKSPGDMVAPGTVIDVIVSASAEKYPVPNFTGETLDNVYSSNIDTFSLTVIEEYNEHIEAGIVIRQDPQKGSMHPAGTKIELYVSLGKGQSIVPYLLGKTETEAESLLIENGLKLGSITNRESSTVAKGLVMEQSISYGQEIYSGALIGIVVSLGKTESTPTPTPTSSPTETPTETPAEIPTEPPTEAPAETPAETPIPEPTETPPGEPVETPEQTTVITPTEPPVQTTPEPTETTIHTVEPQTTETPRPSEETQSPDFIAEAVTKTININPTFDAMFDGVENVTVTLVKKIGGVSTDVYSTQRAINEFPFSVPLTDRGVVTYDIVVNGIITDSVTIDFGDVS